MPLNQGQEAAVTAVFQFLFSDDKEFIISGPAGVGKTFLMRHIMQTVLQEYEDACTLLSMKPVNYEIALTATTNKAAEVLQLSSFFPTETIHKFMNLKVNDNYQTGKSDIVRTPGWVVHTRKLIFVDEASMVDTKLHDFILMGTDNTCKIIYLGDHCQMAPVFESLSPVYRQPKHFVLLTEPVRNAGQPALVSLCTQLRNTVEDLQFQPWSASPGVIEYLDDAQAKAFIDDTFHDEDADARILCYTNDRVQEYNQYIRGLRNYPDQFTAGESLINNSAFNIGSSFLRVEQEVKINKILSEPYDVSLDDKDPNASFSAYDVELESPPIRLKIPLNPDHFKALSKHYARQKDWNRFYKMKNGYPDLRQKDAATVYKAQGCTYETVFLDLGDIGKCKQSDQAARMLYVGASRATTKLYLYGQLPPRYWNTQAAA